jgi:MoaA/NifB/PqqE/SkfB family radical SAM enzyme
MRPILCNYYTTYRCNARCGFCDIWEQPSPLISLADATQNLNDLRRLGVRVVDFTGGEPLLHPELDELLSIARGVGMRTSVTTNGLLYPKRAGSLAGKIDLLHFSIDSADGDAHDRSRGVKCFDSLMESIRVALDIGERPDILFTVTNDNVDQLERIYEEISLPNKLVLIVNPLFEYNALGDSLASDVLEQMERFGKRPYTYLNPAFLTLRRSGGNDPDDPVCRAVSTTIVISPFNELILPCYHYGLDRLPIEGRLFDLWNSEIVDEHRRMEGRHEVCKGCTINCYFEPSFATAPAQRYFWESLPSKMNYAWTKLVLQRMDARRGGREAILPEFERRHAAA